MNTQHESYQDFQARIFDEIDEKESLRIKNALDKLSMPGKDVGLNTYKLLSAGMTVQEILELCRARLHSATGQAAGRSS